MSVAKAIPVEIVERIFSNWTALKMAIEHGMGTSGQAREFCEYIVELISMNEKLDHSDVAAELEDYMDEHFNTRLEDESEKQVAEEILRLQGLLNTNDSNMFESELSKLPPAQPWIQMAHVSRPTNQYVDSSDEDENSDCDNASSSKMEVDEEGFTMVRRKKK